MKHALSLLLPLAALLVFADSAEAQQRFTVRDKTSHGTPFQGQVIVRDGQLDARITIQGVERKRRFRVAIPEGREVVGVDIVETPSNAGEEAKPEKQPSDGEGVKDEGNEGITQRFGDLEKTGTNADGTATGDAKDPEKLPEKQPPAEAAFRNPDDFRLVPILKGDGYVVQILDSEGAVLDVEAERLVGEPFAAKAALFAADDAEYATPLADLSSTFRWSVEGQQLLNFNVSVAEYQGATLSLTHGRRDKAMAYERYKDIIVLTHTPLAFEHLQAADLELIWQTEGPGARKLSVTADVETDGFKERYTKEVEVKVRRTDNPARFVFSCEGKRALPGGFEVLPNHRAWHSSYRGTDKFIFFHREFLRFYNEFRELFGYMRVMEEYDPTEPAYGEDLANYTYLTEEGGTQTSPQHGAKKLSEFENVSDLGDDLEGPFHNRGHMTISRVEGDMASVYTAPMCEVFFMWHTKVDNVALDYEDLAETTKAIEDAEAEAERTLGAREDDPAYGDLSGMWTASGNLPDGTPFTALATIASTGHNLYQISGRGNLEDGRGITWSAQARRNSESELQVLHNTTSRGIAGRILPADHEGSVPAIKGSYAIASEEAFAGAFNLGELSGRIEYTKGSLPTVTFDPATITVRSGQTVTATVTISPPEAVSSVWVTDTGWMIKPGAVQTNRRLGAKRVFLEGQAPGTFELQALLGKGGAVLGSAQVTVTRHIGDDLESRVQEAENPIVVFDIDDTLFDSRVRSQGILRMFGEANGEARLLDVPLDKIRNDVFSTLRALRFPRAEVEGELGRAVKAFHDRRMNDGQQLHLDAVHSGGLDFVRRMQAAGARIVYLSERPLDHQGATQQALWSNGFPPGDLIVMQFEQSVARWKADHITRLSSEGTVVAVFDNEPRVANAIRAAAPDAAVIRLDTVKKPQSPELSEGVESLKTFK